MCIWEGHDATDVVNISTVEGGGRAREKGMLHVIENNVGVRYCNRGAHRCAFGLVVDGVVKYAEVVVKNPGKKIEECIEYTWGETGETFAGVTNGS